jgi:hypothetical protein
MAVGSNYEAAVVLINRHEPEGEVAGRLLEIAEDKGYDARDVQASRGEHDVALSFRVPKDVAEEFDADRAERWPADKIENDKPDVAGVDGDAFAADGTRRANEVRAANAARTEDDENPPPVRHARQSKTLKE